MAVQPYDLYAVNYDRDAAAVVLIDQITDFSLSAQISEILGSGDGDVYSKFVAIGQQGPRLNFTTTKLSVIDDVGLVGSLITSTTAADGLHAWFQKYDSGGLRTAGSTHILMEVSEGLIIPRTLTAGLSAPATLSYEVIAIDNGTDEPILITDSQPLEGSPDVSELFVAGQVDVNGATVEGIQDISVDFGITEKVVFADGGVWPKFVAIQSINPIITVRTANMVTLATFGLDGVAQAATDSIIYLRALKAGGSREIDGASKHIKLEVAEGIIVPLDAGGSHGGDVGYGFRIITTYDGSLAPIVITKETTIA